MLTEIIAWVLYAAFLIYPAILGAGGMRKALRSLRDGNQTEAIGHTGASLVPLIFSAVLLYHGTNISRLTS